METLVMEGEQINLPKRILNKFRGKRIEMVETNEGILLKPKGDAIKEARGILKGSRFNTETFLKQKQED